MAIWSYRLTLHQHDMVKQTTGEYIIFVILKVGGVLMALIAAFGLGRSSKKQSCAASTTMAQTRVDLKVRLVGRSRGERLG